MLPGYVGVLLESFHLNKASFSKAGFNQTLAPITWPKQLQSLTFGELFDQSLESVRLDLEDVFISRWWQLKHFWNVHP